MTANTEGPLVERSKSPCRRAGAACHSLLRRDEGIALAFVALLGAVFILLSTVMVMRAFNTFESTRSDRAWEESFAVSEGGSDVAIRDLAKDPPPPPPPPPPPSNTRTT